METAGGDGEDASGIDDAPAVPMAVLDYRHGRPGLVALLHTTFASRSCAGGKAQWARGRSIQGILSLLPLQLRWHGHVSSVSLALRVVEPAAARRAASGQWAVCLLWTSAAKRRCMVLVINRTDGHG